MHPDKGIRKRRNLLIALIGTAFVFILVGAVAHLTSSTGAQSTRYEMLEQQKHDGEGRIRNGWELTDYALERMPADMAAGEWSSSRNAWNCNLERFDCVEVDFTIPKNDLKAEWVISYEKGTTEYFATRTLSNAADMLFKQGVNQADVQRLPAEVSDSSSAHKPVIGVPAKGEMTKFIQRHYQMGSELKALYAKSAPGADADWGEVPSTDYQKQDVCRAEEADCYTVLYSDLKNRVICYWTVAISRSNSEDQLAYASDVARK